MTVYRCQVVIPATTAIPADSMVNTWTFDLTGATSPEADVAAALKALYDAWGTYRSPLYVWDATHFVGYRLSDSPPRVPVFDIDLDLAPAAGTAALPSEVALCVSFQALRVSGQNQRRRRNRVYLGAFAEVANSSGGRPESPFLTNVRDGFQAFLNSANTDPDWSWVVFSTFNAPTVSIPVKDGWVDDSWDTQRRRGQDPTARLAFTSAS